MVVIFNKILPLGKRTIAINLFGLIFVKERYRDQITPVTLNHEMIHTTQLRETAFLFFYIWYILEYVVKLVYYGNPEKAYINLSLEREAYSNEADLSYLSNRKFWAFIKFL